MTGKARLGVICAIVGSFLWAVGGYVLCFIWLKVPSQDIGQNITDEYGRALVNTAIKAGGIGIIIGLVIGIITWKVFVTRPKKEHKVIKPEKRNRMFGLAPITQAEAFAPYCAYVPTAFSTIAVFYYILPILDDTDLLILKPFNLKLLFTLFIEAGIVTIPILPISIAINSRIFKLDRSIVYEKFDRPIDTIDEEFPGFSKSKVKRFLYKHAFVYTAKNILFCLFFSWLGLALFLTGYYLFLAFGNEKGGLLLPCFFFLAIALVPWGAIFTIIGIAFSFYTLKYLLTKATPGKTPEETAKRYIVGVIASTGFLLSPPYHQAWVLLIPSVAEKYGSFKVFKRYWESFSNRYRKKEIGTPSVKPSWKVDIQIKMNGTNSAQANIKLIAKKSSVGTVHKPLDLQKVGRYWYIANDHTDYSLVSLKKDHNKPDANDGK